MENNEKKIDAFFAEMRKQAENGKEFSNGSNKARWAWTGRRKDYEEFVIDNYVWESEIHDFIGTLREAGVKSFIFTDQSTALMYNIHGFVAEGCKMVGLATVEHKDFIINTTIQGIRFSL